jgi:hypothetical protein
VIAESRLGLSEPLDKFVNLPYCPCDNLIH